MTDKNSNRYIGYAYAGTTALFWGFLAIAIKVAVVSVPPTTIVWFRFLIAFLVLFLYFIIKDPGKLKILIKPPVKLVFAATGLAANYIGFAYGIQYTSPGTSQIFIQLGPMLLAIAGIVIFKEKVSRRQLAGFAIAGLGFILFYNSQLNGIGSNVGNFVKGIAWLVFAAVTWVMYAIFQKQLVKKYPAQQLNLVIYGLPILIYLPFVEMDSISALDSQGWLLMLFLGLNTLIAYGCLGEAFKYAEATKISIIITLNPIITFIALAVLNYLEVPWLERENITPESTLGAAVVLLGALMVIIPGKKS